MSTPYSHKSASMFVMHYERIQTYTESGKKSHCLEQGKQTKPKKICAKNTIEKYPERGTPKWHPTILSNAGKRLKKEELLVVSFFHIRKICCLSKFFRISFCKHFLEIQNTVIAVTTATRSGVKDLCYA